MMDTRPVRDLETVTSAEFVRRFGSWQDRVASDPIVVTHHGRRRVVMLSMQQFETLAGVAGAAANDDGDVAARLAMLVDRLDAGFVALDERSRVIEVNAPAVAHLGVSRAALLGRPLGELPSDLARSIAASHLARALATGEVVQFEYPSLDHPGSWLRAQGFPFGRGAALLFRNIDREIEGLRLAGRLASHEAALAAHGGVGVGRLSLRGTFVEVDDTLAALAGFEAPNLAQVRLTDILALGCRAAVAAEVESVLGGGGAQAFDARLLVRRGGEVPVRIALAELRGDYAIDGASVVITPS